MKNQKSSSLLGKTLSVILILILLSSLAAFVYNIASPPVNEKFTEFYLLGANGKAADYPNNLTVGEEAHVTVGIVNREQEPVNYRIEVAVNGTPNNKVGPVELNQGQTWQQAVTFRPAIAGNKEKVEFLLYKAGQDAVYRSVYILVNVQ